MKMNKGKAYFSLCLV